MVEIFKTNVQLVSQAALLRALLLQHFPGSDIHFDLEDCDKVLRFEGKPCQAERIIWLITANGYSCKVLE